MSNHSLVSLVPQRFGRLLESFFLTITAHYFGLFWALSANLVVLQLVYSWSKGANMRIKVDKVVRLITRSASIGYIHPPLISLYHSRPERFLSGAVVYAYLSSVRTVTDEQDQD